MNDYIAHLNGRLPKGLLHDLSWAPKQKVLRGMPAVNLEELNRRYRRRFGVDLQVNHSYRSWWRQVGVKFLYGDKSAPVGHSMHGFGLALDLGGGVNKFDTVEHEWMRANAPMHGWVNPEWAQCEGTNPEAWHWEFL